jgi:hypothetical protein
MIPCQYHFSFFRKQKELAEEKRKVAKLEIERQKEIMQEKERLIQAFIKVFKGTDSLEGKICLTVSKIKSGTFYHAQRVFFLFKGCLVKQKIVKISKYCSECRIENFCSGFPSLSLVDFLPYIVCHIRLSGIFLEL